MAKKKTQAQLVKKLDTVFSLYVRTRDALATCWSTEAAKCISCGHITPWPKIDAGHFMSRRHFATRWDEKNVHAQCKGCNMTGGQQYIYGKAIDAKYGFGTAEELSNRSRSIFKQPTFWFQEQVDLYTEKLWKLQ